MDFNIMGNPLHRNLPLSLYPPIQRCELIKIAMQVLAFFHNIVKEREGGERKNC